VKITYLYQYFGTPAGSWSTRVYELTRRWVEEGHEVTVITSPYTKSDINTNRFIDRRLIDGINVIIINSGDNNLLPTWKRILKALIFALASCYIHIRTKTDITIASSGPITIGFPALIGKWFSKKKFIFEVRDLWPIGAIELGLINNKTLANIGLYIEKICYNNSECVVPCSEGMSLNIKERFPDISTLVIPNASDVKLFKSKKYFTFPDWFDPLKKTFIYAGSIGFMDSCMEIVHGLNESINKSNIQVIIFGKGSEEFELRNEINRLKLDNQIKVLALVPKSELVAWYQISIASFVLFKNFNVLSTSSPNKMFDSFAAGVPIIQNTTGWIKDLVDENICGFNIESNNPKSMALAIDSIFENDTLQKKMSNNAFLLANQRFNRDNLADEYLKKLVSLSRK
jgi:glycosyltransferase involved in cell wall biosynthesis